MNDRTAFRRAVEAGDLGSMIDAIRGDAVLHSPVSFQPFRGRKAIGGLLYVLTQVFEDFRYTDELNGEDGSKALVFRARVEDRDVEGVDLLRFDEQDLVKEITVMIRPLSGLEALRDAVAPKLDSLGAEPPDRAIHEREDR